jgi:hypothetical protein
MKYFTKSSSGNFPYYLSSHPYVNRILNWSSVKSQCPCGMWIGVNFTLDYFYYSGESWVYNRGKEDKKFVKVFNSYLQ